MHKGPARGRALVGVVCTLWPREAIPRDRPIPSRARVRVRNVPCSDHLDEYGRRPLLVGSRERCREHFLAGLVRDGHGQNGDLVRRHRSEKMFGVLIVVLCPDRVSG
jgi:hypothetical protein